MITERGMQYQLSSVEISLTDCRICGKLLNTTVLTKWEET